MIIINNLNVAYGKRETILSDLNAQLSPGHCFGLLGMNGAGKTTLLKAIMGGIIPKSGKITCHRFDTAHRNNSSFEQMYWVPEIVLLPNVKLHTFLKMNACFYPNFNQETFNSMLEVLQVPKTNMLNALSQGQQKKLAIAFGLAVGTSWLILDEPTNGLDIPSKQQFQKLMSQYMSPEQGIIISTHQIDDIKNLIDHVLILHNQKMVLSASIQELESSYCTEDINHPTDNSNTIYQEENGLGYKVLSKNTSQTEAPIDLKLLFNAVTTHPQLFS